MYLKSRNDLIWSCCGEDVADKTKGLGAVKKNPVLLIKGKPSITWYLMTGEDCRYKTDGLNRTFTSLI